MNISKHLDHSLRIVHSALCIALLVAGSAVADPSISNVSARQRWPWNSLVDVDFTIAGAASGEAYAVSVSGTTVTPDGTATLHAKTFATEPIAKAGANRVVWDFGADYPDTKVDDLLVTVTATPFSDTTPVYLIVDISGGTSAAKWPVRYTTTPPVHTPGVEDPCKTTELWLKRVKAGTMQMGGDSGLGNYCYKSHTCVLTEDYYLGLFELTQAQCYNIKGAYHSAFTNTLYRATRPVDSAVADSSPIRMPYFNSASPNASPNDTCVIGRLRNRTGLAFDLPTEWQWEYACRAGETGAFYYQTMPNNGNPGSVSSLYRCKSNAYPPDGYEWKNLQGMWSADYGTSYVDQYPPNKWGFYGIMGNVAEICLNRTQTIAAGDTVTDPLGDANTSGTGTRIRKIRGGVWTGDWSDKCRYAWMWAPDPWNGGTAYLVGARICLTIRKSAE